MRSCNWELLESTDLCLKQSAIGSTKISSTLVAANRCHGFSCPCGVRPVDKEREDLSEKIAAS